jgi:hypothetical protein
MHDDKGGQGPSLVSIRTMDIVVAVFCLVLAAIVIMDSTRLGFGWKDDGPAAGYFPFYIGLIIVAASLVNLVRAIADKSAADDVFVTKPAFRQVLAVLAPLCVYVLFIELAGIYVASAIYIALFMWYFGRYSLAKGAAIGVAVSLSLFVMFEVWFLVPLPKGPIEDFFGF